MFHFKRWGGVAGGLVGTAGPLTRLLYADCEPPDQRFPLVGARVLSAASGSTGERVAVCVCELDGKVVDQTFADLDNDFCAFSVAASGAYAAATTREGWLLIWDAKSLAAPESSTVTVAPNIVATPFFVATLAATPPSASARRGTTAALAAELENILKASHFHPRGIGSPQAGLARKPSSIFSRGKGGRGISGSPTVFRSVTSLTVSDDGSCVAFSCDGAGYGNGADAAAASQGRAASDVSQVGETWLWRGATWEDRVGVWSMVPMVLPTASASLRATSSGGASSRSAFRALDARFCDNDSVGHALCCVDAWPRPAPQVLTASATGGAAAGHAPPVVDIAFWAARVPDHASVPGDAAVASRCV